ncbi:Transcription factor MYB86 [Acorus calamus]|uniref:Transcription factor MYB86 n=1 Tax=Acorus calamus TaxID=4465 RepID=A0AAV9EYI3_ACOCL|nr:Transcription factor MYB86 [Acorus calamus]
MEDDIQGREPEEAIMNTKKRLWTREEDEILEEHVRNEGEKNWHKVPMRYDLPRRSGRSCRLRWVNQLKQDLNKEAFTENEDKIITALQELLGNEWSLAGKK